MQITKPSIKKLKRDGFKLVFDRQIKSSGVFVQCVDKEFFARHPEYFKDSKTIKIYENDSKVLIYQKH